jgi:hypothetical protein
MERYIISKEGMMLAPAPDIAKNISFAKTDA